VLRYLIVVVPALALLAAVGLTKTHPRWLAGVAFLVIVLLAAIGLKEMYGKPKEDWRGTVAYVERRVQQTDGLIFPVGYVLPSYKFYEARSSSDIELPVEFPTEGAPTAVDFGRLVRRGGIDPARIWFVTSHAWSPEQRQTLATLRRAVETRFEVVEEQQLFQIHVRLYERQPSETVGG
jgi:hypothetical protein